MSQPTRHIPVTTLKDYDESGVAGVLTVTGDPTGRIRIAPRERRLSLLVRATADLAGPDLQLLAHVEYVLDREAGVAWHRLDVTYADNLAEVYAVLCTVLDRVQLDGDTFATAVEAVLLGLGDILAGTDELSRDRQVGLFGELLTLLSLAAASSAGAALDGWRGPRGEEHDFGLDDIDVEVKTTTAERRVHWISGLTQLLPTGERPLLLLSIQVTGAGTGPGAALPELVSAARTEAGSARWTLDSRLTAAGYQDRHTPLYGERWTLRTTPSFHLVDEDFPALTPTGLAGGTRQSQRILDVRYRIDLDGLAPTAAPFPVVLTPGANQ